MQLTSLPAVVLRDMIAAGRVSPVAVVEAHIARIEALNPALRALVAERFAAARQEALDAAAIPPRFHGPLHGLPVTIKGAIDVAGMAATCGLVSRARRVAERDATLVARLRAAGAIVLGGSATPDNCWSQETETLLHGRTSNPWDRSRTVGGSTGGEAALIAAGCSPLGVGSDIAGSIRLPAAFCGIVGLRPSSGALPEYGFWPPSVGALAQLNALGPMARRVEDVALAWDVLRGAEPRPPDLAALRGQPLAHWLDDGLLPSSAAVRAGVRAAARVLEAAGMRPVAGAPLARRLAVVGWGAAHGLTERRAVAEGFGGGTPWSPLAELARALVGRSRVTPTALTYWLASHYGVDLRRLLGIDGQRWGETLRVQLHELIGAGGVAVCPVFPTTAPPHGYSYLALLATMSFQVWVNLAGLPGLTVPVGFTGRGMPVAVQLVGAPGTETTLLAAGMAVQRALMPEWRGPAL